MMFVTKGNFPLNQMAGVMIIDQALASLSCDSSHDQALHGHITAIQIS